MSSNEEVEGPSHAQPSRRRKVQRACNLCRRRKSDGNETPDGSACSNCISSGQECIYATTLTKRGPYHGKSYVQKLENRLEKMERLFRQLHPELDLEDIDNLIHSENTPTPLSRMSPGPGTPKDVDHSGYIQSVIRAAAEIPTIPDDDYDLIDIHLIEELGGIPLNDRNPNRFFGKSSEPAFLQAAMDIKREVAGLSIGNVTEYSRCLPHRREEFWEIPSWESFMSIESPPPTYNFPDADLMPILIDKYFKHWNLYLPLLHRPTFEKAISQGLHLVDPSFGAVVLLVCSNGAKFCDDPRVLLDGTKSPLSRGWKWFLQVQVIRKSLVQSTKLYDLQFYCLAVDFLKGSSYTHASWFLVGVALRLAQDVGVHRWKTKTSPVTVEHELWKRAFWVLIIMDRTLSVILGRSSAIGDEDFDLDYPVEVDDEYWEHPDPSQAFKQPPNKPSLITSFNYHLRLTHILGMALRALYSNNKTKTFLGLIGHEQSLVSEFDSNLNKWLDSLPDHLRWNPSREDDAFFDLSADLHAYFYYVRIVVHRPFIRTPSPMLLPSMTICTNAARTCSHIIDIQRRRHPSNPILTGAIGAFASGIVMLLRLWSAKRSGLLTNPKNDMGDVYKCMEMLRGLELQWSIAGRLWDILYELADIGDLPVPRPHPSPHQGERSVNVPSPFVISPTVPLVSHHHLADSPHIMDYSHPVQFDSASPASQSSQHHSSFSPLSSDPTTAPMNGHFYPIPRSPEPPSGDTAGSRIGGSNPPHQHPATYSQAYRDPAPLGNGSVWSSLTTGLDLRNQATGTLIDNDIIDMWMSAPSGFELDDWGRYFSNVDGITHGSPGSHNT